MVEQLLSTEHVQDFSHVLVGGTIFSVVDCKKVYLQIPMVEEDIPLCFLDSLECLHMP